MFIPRHSHLLAWWKPNKVKKQQQHQQHIFSMYSKHLKRSSAKCRLFNRHKKPPYCTDSLFCWSPTVFSWHPDDEKDKWRRRSHLRTIPQSASLAWVTKFNHFQTDFMFVILLFFPPFFLSLQTQTGLMSKCVQIFKALWDRDACKMPNSYTEGPRFESALAHRSPLTSKRGTESAQLTIQSFD